MSFGIQAMTRVARLVVEGVDRARPVAITNGRLAALRAVAASKALSQAFGLRAVPMTEDRALEVLSTRFDTFDGADRGGRTDGKAGREAFQAVVDNAPSYTPEEVAVARYVLNDADFYLRLDVAKNGSSAYHYADGVIGRGDVDSLVARKELWARRSGGVDAATFTAEGYQIPEGFRYSVAADATPLEAAAFFRNLETMGGLTSEEAGAQFFVDVLRDHQDDAGWQRRFLTALGSDRSAELLADALSPGTYSQRTEAAALDSVEVVQGSLQELYEAGALNSADMDRLMEHWALERGDFRPWVADAFATLPAKSEGLQTMFFESAVRLATDGTVSRLSDGDRQSLAGAAAHVLAGTSTDNQVIRLLELRDQGLIERFVELAMDNPTTELSVAGLTTEHADTPFTSFTEDPANPRIMRYDGLGRLMMTVAQARATHSNRGYNSPYFETPFSEQDLTNLRVDLFAPAANGLAANSRHWQDTVTLQDALSKIFMSEFDALVDANVVPRNGVIANDNQFIEGLSNFFRYAVFTEPTSGSRDRVIEFFTTEANQRRLHIAELAARGEDDAAQAEALALGQIIGASVTGLEAAIAEAEGKRASQDAAIKFFVDLGFDLIPGASAGKGVVKSLIDSLEGELKDQVRTMTTEQLQEFLLEELPGLEHSEVLNGSKGLIQDLAEQMPNAETADALLSGYSYVVVESLRLG